MELTSLGEFGLIDLIKIPAYQPEQLVLGIGDDCAVLPFDQEHYQLVSCDLLIEDVHFIRNKITARQLGYKAVAVNLSDIAAMGGKPVHILLSVALPADYTVEEWQAFYQGVDEICKKYQVNVIGGDTTSSKGGMSINVTAIGLVEKANLHFRKDAQVGDVIFTTGLLGGSRAGLELILQDQQDHLQLTDAERQYLLQRHCQPEPCCAEIEILNQLAGDGLHGLNDISDGLLSECNEIAQASQVALFLSAEQIPVDTIGCKVAEQCGHDGLQWALQGGEDYQLVGTMDGTQAQSVCTRYEQITGKKLYILGSVQAGQGVFLQDTAGTHKMGAKGYNHFVSQKNNLAAETTVSQDEEVCQSLLQWRIAELQRQEERQSAYRHDLHNHLACLSGLLECGQVQQAAAYLRQMIAHVPLSKKETYSQRIVLNLLLNQKAQLAQQKQIDLQIHCQNTELDFLSDYDISTLLGNLLDNGLEHSGQAHDAYLYLDIWLNQAGETVIRMENSCYKPPAVQDGALSSSKADAAQHGKGMGQIQCVTEQHGGQFSWIYEEQYQRFISQCVFPKIS